LTALAAAPLLADFTYTETSTITGGAMLSMLKIAGVFSKQAREPIVSTVSVKGDRMLHKSSTHASAIDLSSQTITSIDFQKKQYSVMTFDEMKQMLEHMSQKMKEKDNGEVKFKVSANSTGKTKQAAGFDAKEMIMKMEMEGTDAKSGQKGAMTITTDMWIAQGVPGYQEVRNFYKRMAEKLNWTPGGNMFMQNVEVSKGMAEVYKEMAKLDGVPVEQFITMGGSGDGTAASQPAPAQQQEKPSMSGALGSALGGRFGLGKKKKTDDAPAEQNTAASSGGSSGSLLEMNTVMSSFNSNPVDSSSFEPPAGFKKVEPDMKRIR
jgi:hypothetical protein